MTEALPSLLALDNNHCTGRFNLPAFSLQHLANSRSQLCSPASAVLTSSNNDTEPGPSVVCAYATVDLALPHAVPPCLCSLLRDSHAIQHVNTVQIKVRRRRLSIRQCIRRIGGSTKGQRGQVAADLRVMGCSASHQTV